MQLFASAWVEPGTLLTAHSDHDSHGFDRNSAGTVVDAEAAVGGDC